MSKIMTIAAEPAKIFDFVVFTILIDVMHDKNPQIGNTAVIAHRLFTCTKHDLAVDTLTASPVEVVFAEAPEFVLPLAVAGFIAEEATILRFRELFWRTIDVCTTCSAGVNFSSKHAFYLTGI